MPIAMLRVKLKDTRQKIKKHTDIIKRGANQAAQLIKSKITNNLHILKSFIKRADYIHLSLFLLSYLFSSSNFENGITWSELQGW